MIDAIVEFMVDWFLLERGVMVVFGLPILILSFYHLLYVC